MIIMGTSARCDYSDVLDQCLNRTEDVLRTEGWVMVPAKRSCPELHYCPEHRAEAGSAVPDA